MRSTDITLSKRLLLEQLLDLAVLVPARGI